MKTPVDHTDATAAGLSMLLSVKLEDFGKTDLGLTNKSGSINSSKALRDNPEIDAPAGKMYNQTLPQETTSRISLKQAVAYRQILKKTLFHA